MGRQKAVGYRHETEVARLLTEWWGASFARTPNSGALRWNGLTWTFGDLLPPEDFPAVVECKRRKGIQWHYLFDQDRKITPEHHPLSWWQQSQDDATRCYTETKRVVQPIVVCKTIRRPNRIFIEADFYAALGGRNLGLSSLWVTHPKYVPFVILDLTSFFSAVDREAFLKGVRSVIPAALVEAVV